MDSHRVPQYRNAWTAELRFWKGPPLRSKKQQDQAQTAQTQNKKRFSVAFWTCKEKRWKKIRKDEWQWNNMQWKTSTSHLFQTMKLAYWTIAETETEKLTCFGTGKTRRRMDEPTCNGKHPRATCSKATKHLETTMKREAIGRHPRATARLASRYAEYAWIACHVLTATTTLHSAISKRWNTNTIPGEATKTLLAWHIRHNGQVPVSTKKLS